MIRQIQESDRAWLQEHGWDCDGTFFGGYVYVVDNKPVVAVGGWRMLEVHAISESTFSTPAVRLGVLQELHRVMEYRMRRDGYGEAVTFFDTIESTCKRLVRLGWQRVNKHVWARKVGA